MAALAERSDAARVNAADERQVLGTGLPSGAHRKPSAGSWVWLVEDRMRPRFNHPITLSWPIGESLISRERPSSPRLRAPG